MSTVTATAAAPEEFRMYDLIYAKKNGQELSAAQLKYWISGVVAGTVPDEQSSALLMAICWRGMTLEETSQLTLLMRDSGHKEDLSAIGKFIVEKHSTGGVGDLATLVIGPLVAACGAHTAMFSGRGLGHTGGTVDKYSSIPGLKVELTDKEFMASLRSTHFTNSAQTGDICPADRKLYALRDVTATVESIPLITASIMSKKLAGGANGLVLDVKCGSGAFMKTLDEARALAESLVRVGQANGMKVKALITRMEEPLGRAIGNALEVQSSVEILQGKYSDSTIAQLSFRLSAEMLVLAGNAADLPDAYQKIDSAIKSGAALKKYQEWVEFNGGDPQSLVDFSRLPHTSHHYEIRAERSGYISMIHSRPLGILAMKLGAGRSYKDQPLDLAVGIHLEKQIGDFVQKGDLLLTVYSRPGQSERKPEGNWIEFVENEKDIPQEYQKNAKDSWLLGIVQ